MLCPLYKTHQRRLPGPLSSLITERTNKAEVLHKSLIAILKNTAGITPFMESVHYGNASIRQKASFFFFFFLLNPPPHITHLQHQETILTCPWLKGRTTWNAFRFGAPTSKRAGAYFWVFCALRLEATSEVAVFPVNSLAFCFTHPSKASSTRAVGMGLSVRSSHQR